VNDLLSKEEISAGCVPRGVGVVELTGGDEPG
jgi:hypothetical protein